MDRFAWGGGGEKGERGGLNFSFDFSKIVA